MVTELTKNEKLNYIRDFFKTRFEDKVRISDWYLHNSLNCINKIHKEKDDHSLTVFETYLLCYIKNRKQIKRLYFQKSVMQRFFNDACSDDFVSDRFVDKLLGLTKKPLITYATEELAYKVVLKEAENIVRVSGDEYEKVKARLLRSKDVLACCDYLRSLNAPDAAALSAQQRKTNINEVQRILKDLYLQQQPIKRTSKYVCEEEIMALNTEKTLVEQLKTIRTLLEIKEEKEKAKRVQTMLDISIDVFADNNYSSADAFIKKQNADCNGCENCE